MRSMRQSSTPSFTTTGTSANLFSACSTTGLRFYLMAECRIPRRRKGSFRESASQGISLMRVFQDLEITEKTGHGTVKIISAYGKEAFNIQDGFIQVTIPFNKKVMKSRGTINSNINSDLSKNELSLIGVIIQKSGITLTEVAEILGVSKRTASRIFASLQEKGCVKREGSNKNGVWKVVK